MALQDVQSQIQNLDPEARQNLIQAIQEELERRGESPEGGVPQKRGFISGLTGQTQGGGILPRLGQGLRAGVKALPSILGVQTGEKKEEPSFFEKEIFKARLKDEAKDEKENFDSAARKAIGGDISFEELMNRFPSKRNKILDLEEDARIKEERETPVEQDPEFERGTGGLISKVGSFFKGTQAEITPKTQAMIDQIKNEEDIDELISREAEAKEKGIDIKAIYEFFGITPAEVERRKAEIEQGLR